MLARPARANGLADWLVTLGIALALAAVAVQTTGHLLQAFASSSLDQLDADRDDNVWAWASSVATFGAGFAAFLLYALRRRSALLLLTLLLVFLSLDDIVGVHERIGQRGVKWIDVDFDALRVLWIAVYLPLLAAGVVLLVRLAREASARPRLLVYVGLGLLGFAVGVEAASYLTHEAGYAEGTSVDSIEVAIEEGAELGGWILLAAALTAHACTELLAAGRSTPPE